MLRDFWATGYGFLVPIVSGAVQFTSAEEKYLLLRYFRLLRELHCTKTTLISAWFRANSTHLLFSLLCLCS